MNLKWPLRWVSLYAQPDIGCILMSLSRQMLLWYVSSYSTLRLGTAGDHYRGCILQRFVLCFPEIGVCQPFYQDYAIVCARQRSITVHRVSNAWLVGKLYLITTFRTNWAFNFLVGEATPYLQEVITWRLYVMHGFFCACSVVLGKNVPSLSVCCWWVPPSSLFL